MKIQRFQEFGYDEMVSDFLNSIIENISESDSEKNVYKRIQDKVMADLNLNIKLVATFGAGIGSLYPIVEKLMKGSGIGMSDVTPDKVVLLTLAAVAITYLEEKKFKSAEEEQELIDDSKSMLEELKMRGVGNGIVKKLMKSLESVKNIFSIIGKHLGAVVGGVIDMFAYTSLLIPILNGVLSIVNKYDLTLDTLPQNFLGLAMGIGTIIAKHGIIEILNKIKDKFGINISSKEVIDEIETPVIQRFATFGDSEKDKDQQEGDLIKEQ